MRDALFLDLCGKSGLPHSLLCCLSPARSVQVPCPVPAALPPARTVQLCSWGRRPRAAGRGDRLLPAACEGLATGTHGTAQHSSGFCFPAKVGDRGGKRAGSPYTVVLELGALSSCPAPRRFLLGGERQVSTSVTRSQGRSPAPRGVPAPSPVSAPRGLLSFPCSKAFASAVCVWLPRSRRRLCLLSLLPRTRQGVCSPPLRGSQPPSVFPVRSPSLLERSQRPGQSRPVRVTPGPVRPEVLQCPLRAAVTAAWRGAAVRLSRSLTVPVLAAASPVSPGSLWLLPAGSCLSPAWRPLGTELRGVRPCRP